MKYRNAKPDMTIQETFVSDKRDASSALEIRLLSNIEKQDLRMLNVFRAMIIILKYKACQVYKEHVFSTGKKQ